MGALDAIDSQGAAQQRLESVMRFEHHELPGTGVNRLPEIQRQQFVSLGDFAVAFDCGDGIYHQICRDKNSFARAASRESSVRLSLAIRLQELN
jgi:hypothetical protein